MSQRLAGQALPNGVLIRSKQNWALATDDGQVRFGKCSSWLDRHPALNIFLVRSVVGLIEAIVFALRLQRDLTADRGRSFFRPLAIYFAITAPLAFLVDGPGRGAWVYHAGLQVLAFATALVVFSRVLPRSLWAYHGAEHKAVDAHERQVDLNDIGAVRRCSRVHNRCGTNLVTLFLLVSVFPLPVSASIPALVGSIFYSLLLLGVCVELFRLISKTPHLAISKLFLMPGRWLQEHLTTREPDHFQVAVALRAVKAVLALDAMEAARQQKLA